MGVWRGKGEASPDDVHVHSKDEYGDDFNGPAAVVSDVDEGIELQRGLKARHITMIGMFFDNNIYFRNIYILLTRLTIHH